MYKYKGRISEEMYHQACAVDLYAFLTSRHSDRVRQKYGSALLLENEHVSVKKGFHGFTNFRSGETGNNVTYLCSFLDYGYRDAVLALLGFSGGLTEFGNNIDYDPMSLKKAKIRAASKEHYALPEKLDLKDFTIPKPINGRYRHLFAYLRNRGIPVETIKTLVDEGILYQEEAHNNIVFINPEKDYYEVRGTNSFADKRCKHREQCSGFSPEDHGWCIEMNTCMSYKPDAFHGRKGAKPNRFWYYAPHKGKNSVIYICEAAVDAISLYVIHKLQGNQESAVYVSIGGAGNQGTIDRIVRGAGDRKVVLAVDNDSAGQDCRDRNPEMEYILPKNKDWNEDLKEDML